MILARTLRRAADVNEYLRRISGADFTASEELAVLLLLRRRLAARREDGHPAERAA